MPAILWDLPGDAPRLTRETLTGILVAITGNILISFALNLQKLAHRRLEICAKKRVNFQSPVDNSQPISTNIRSPDIRSDYGTLPRSKSPRPFSDSLSSVVTTPVNSEEALLLSTPQKKDAREGDWNESRYLKSKVWWLGFLLMNVGEVGNFISYAFAPASVVAPLGTFALMSNCIFAPCMLGEQFKKRDLFGIILAIIGAVTVVLSSNSTETPMDPDALQRAIIRWPFIAYSAIYAGGAAILITLSHGKLGQKWVVIDVGLCALFGGFTVLSTKALSTLLTRKWVDIFSEWITYPVILVLIGTGVGQIRHLNRALMRFDSKVVIPIQFVLFTLSAIIGSAILYGDFEKATFHQTVTFLYGVATTFAGVFAIAWAPNDAPAINDPPDSEAGPAVSASQQYRSLSRRRGALVSNSRESAALKNRRSRIDVISLSPAKHLLLVERERLNDESEVDEPSSHGLRTSSSFELRRNAGVAGLVETHTIGRYARDETDISEQERAPI